MVYKTVLADYKKENGTKNVEIYIYHAREKVTIKTEHYILPGQFDKGKIIKHPNADYLNANLDEIKNKLQRHALKNEGITPYELKKWYLGSGQMTFFGYIDYFVKGIKDKSILIKSRGPNNGKPYKKNTIQNYMVNTDLLKEFNPKLNWKDINEDFLNGYIVWLRAKNFADNTIAKAVNILCAIMERSKKIHGTLDYQEFYIPYTDSDSIFLTESEIELIMKATLPKHLEAERLRFYLSYNFFLRFGDSVTLDKEDIFKQEGRTYAKLMDEKTHNIRIIPVLPYTLDLLKKCNYNLPKSTNQESNRDLKDIGKLAGIDSIHTQITVKSGEISKLPACKYNFITTHTARRSMATNVYLSMVKHKNVDLKKLQLMGGWKSISMLEKYLKVGKLVNAMSASDDPFFN